MKFSNLMSRFLFCTLLCLVASLAVAQPGDPSVDPDVPITGIELLLIVGGILGIRKLNSVKSRRS
jgi:hypothetical protein